MTPRVPDLTRHDASFKWGGGDCSDMIADAVVQAGGPDIKHDDPGYTDIKGAITALRQAGYSSPADWLDDRLTPVPVAKARPGDIVARARHRLGVCAGRVSFFRSAEGLERRPTSACNRAWRASGE